MIETFRTEKRLPRILWSLLYDYLEGKYIFLESVDDYFEMWYFLQKNSGMVGPSHFINYQRGNPYRKARFKFGTYKKDRIEKLKYSNKKEEGDLTIKELKVLVEGCKDIYLYLNK